MINKIILFLLMLICSVGAYAVLTPSSFYKNIHNYKVKEGDTIYSIANKYNLPFDYLIYDNYLSKPYMLFIGENIKIPALVEHVVHKDNENLITIASFYKVSIVKLQQLNQISSLTGFLPLGTSVKIPALKTKIISPQDTLDELLDSMLSDNNFYIANPEKTTPYKAVEHKAIQSRKKTVTKKKQLITRKKPVYHPKKISKPRQYKYNKKSTAKITMSKKPIVNNKVAKKHIRTHKVVKSPYYRPMLVSKGKFLFPLSRGKITSYYGKPYKGSILYAIYISSSINQNVHSSAKGRVIYSNNKITNMGGVILVSLRNYIIIYGNLKKLFVKEGDIVQRGQIIGTVGITRLSETPKLFYQIRKNKVTVNPMIYFR